jgi:hypothetical protein
MRALRVVGLVSLLVAGGLAASACDKPAGGKDTTKRTPLPSAKPEEIAALNPISSSGTFGMRPLPAVKRRAQELDPRPLGVGTLIDDVAFVDLDGKEGSLGAYRKKTLIVVTWSSSCANATSYLPTLRALADSLAKSPSSALLLVLPHPTEDREKVRASKVFDGMNARVTLSPAIARALAAQSYIEAFVLDGARTLQYRGAIDDQFGVGVALPAPRTRPLDAALTAMASNERPVPAATLPPLGECAIPASTLVSRDAGASAVASPVGVTWNAQIARLVQDRCQGCHRKDQAAPFPLVTLADVKAKASMIDLVVDGRVMPPWFAHPGTGTWRNDRSLTDFQRSTLLGWLRGGMPEGNAKDAPLPRVYPAEFAIGKPDLVVTATDPEPVPDQGVIPYRVILVDPQLTEDRWIQRLELRPSAKQVVHHAQVFIVPPGASAMTAKEIESRLDMRMLIGGLARGGEVESFGPSEGRALPKGSRLLVQVHYTPNGHAVPSSSMRIGLIFTKEKPATELSVLCAMNESFTIPAGAKGYDVSAKKVLAKTTRIVRFVPHMHWRGKRMRYLATLPDGSKRTLFDGGYDFRWQLWYEPADPLELPAGTIIEGIGTFDNSADNPQNPDPKATVRIGQQANDEMMNACMAITESP